MVTRENSFLCFLSCHVALLFRSGFTILLAESLVYSRARRRAPVGVGTVTANTVVLVSYSDTQHRNMSRIQLHVVAKHHTATTVSQTKDLRRIPCVCKTDRQDLGLSHIQIVADRYAPLELALTGYRVICAKVHGLCFL